MSPTLRFEEGDLGSQIPAGVYVVRVDEVKETKSQGGNPMIAVYLEVAHGDFEGEILRDHFVIGGKNRRAARIGRRRLARLCQLSGLEVAIGDKVDLDRLLDRHLAIEVCEDTYRDMLVPRVKAYRRPDKDDPTPF